MSNIINTTDLTNIKAARITGTDGETYTLELRPEISLDDGLRYGVYALETDDDTETSGSWYGAETYNEETGELELTEELRAEAEISAMDAISVAWSAASWHLTDYI